MVGLVNHKASIAARRCWRLRDRDGSPSGCSVLTDASPFCDLVRDGVLRRDEFHPFIEQQVLRDRQPRNLVQPVKEHHVELRGRVLSASGVTRRA